MDNKEYSLKMADGRNLLLSNDYSKSDLRADGGRIAVNQLTLQVSEIMPENSTVFDIALRVIWGKVGLTQNDEEETACTCGSITRIPAKTKIGLSNQFWEESMVFLVRI